MLALGFPIEEASRIFFMVAPPPSSFLLTPHVLQGYSWPTLTHLQLGRERCKYKNYSSASSNEAAEGANSGEVSSGGKMAAVNSGMTTPVHLHT